MSATLTRSDENGAADWYAVVIPIPMYIGIGTCSSGRVARAWPPTCVGGSDKSSPGVLRSAFSEQFPMSASLAMSDENGAAGWGRGCDPPTADLQQREGCSRLAPDLRRGF